VIETFMIVTTGVEEVNLLGLDLPPGQTPLGEKIIIGATIAIGLHAVSVMPLVLHRGRIDAEWKAAPPDDKGEAGRHVESVALPGEVDVVDVQEGISVTIAIEVAALVTRQ